MNELLHTLGLIQPDGAQLQALWLHYLMLSFLSIGGAITTAPEMHRFLVQERGWLTDTQFSGGIALAQAAPGPNILFVAVLGFQVAGLPGALATMSGIMLPSATLVLVATRWAREHQQHIGVRAFTLGLQPLTLGLMLTTGLVMARPYFAAHGQALLTQGSAALRQPQLWCALALLLATVVLALRTRLSLLWLIAVGGVVGALGWV
ncbi:chromate transporter [Roseateles sp. BYS180W]|uniref:Chromate transporter n=1 Tax=Roseateles rivi TaxID=3299028 RepID=A0ABW7FZD8_9BURK